MLTTTPSSIRKPVSVLTLRRVFPVRIRAIRDPRAASGMLKSNTTGVERDSNTAARIMKISRKAIPIR